MRYLPILILSPCRPPPSLFHCEHLERRGPGWWLFIVPTGHARRKLRDMPVGACGFRPKATPPPVIKGEAL